MPDSTKPEKANIWHILTGEYPPQIGGVSDYTAQLANGLAEHGASVCVWTGPTSNAPASQTEPLAGVKVRRIAELWAHNGLLQLNEELSRWTAPRRLLVQYSPNAWGRKGLNFRFCRWLRERRELGDDVHLMVHEPFYPYQLWDKPTRWLLAWGQRRMMRTLLAASNKVYVAIPAWAELIRPFDNVPDRPMTWLPICSTIPVTAELAQVETLRHWFAPNGEFIVGSLGGFGGHVAALTEEVFTTLLARRSNTIALFIGAGGERLAERIARRAPHLATRLRASGKLPAHDISCHLMACDVLFQAYPEGVSTRRTSTIVSMAHGRPIVTLQGDFTESWWNATGGVRLVNAHDKLGAMRAVLALLDDATARHALGSRAQAVYQEHLAVRQTVARLISV